MTDKLQISGLASIINSVKSELQKAREEFDTDKKEPGFLLRNMKIEIGLVAEESTELNGGVDLKIVAVGGKGEMKEQFIHKVVLDFDVVEGTTTYLLNKQNLPGTQAP